MAFAYTDVALWVAEHDVSADANRAALTVSAAELNCSTFGSDGWTEYLLGTSTGTLTYEAFIDSASANVEGAAFAGYNTLAPVSLVPQPSATPAVGDVAYLFRPYRFGQSVDLTHGDTAGASITGTVSGPVARGRLMLPKATISSSSTATAYSLGAVSSTQKLYAALHVFAVTGSPTLDVVVRSDASSGMASPTTQITFTQATAAGSQWQTATGAIADTYFDIDYTFGGTGTITAAVTVAVA